MHVNPEALVAVLAFAGVMLAIFGALYVGAARSYRRGELDFEGIRVLRWALLGQLAIYALLAVTAFLT
jgi:hypothetical protein